MLGNATLTINKSRLASTIPTHTMASTRFGEVTGGAAALRGIWTGLSSKFATDALVNIRLGTTAPPQRLDDRRRMDLHLPRRGFGFRLPGLKPNRIEPHEQ